MNIFDKIRRLSKTQLVALKIFLDNEMASSGAIAEVTRLKGQRLGGVVSSLSRNNLIMPIGKEEGKRTMDWELTEEVKNYKKELKELVDRILVHYLQQN